jgi:hypothetical protein
MARRARRGHAARERREELAKASPVDAPAIGGPSSDRAVSVKVVAPSRIWQGRLENPDQVLRQFGTWEGLAFYDRIFRQFPTVAGVFHLWADHANRIDPVIKAGAPEEGKSREIADKVRSLYRRLPDTHILNKKMLLNGRGFGFAPIGKADWRKDEETGLLAPHDLYDIPPWCIKFGPEGQEYVVTEMSSLGNPIPKRTVFHLRWGTRWTPYGEADTRDIYMATWYIQTIRQMGAQAVEIFGRPIPWVEVPDRVVGDEFVQFEAGLSAQYKYYVITRTPAEKYSVTFPSQAVVASGAAGRSEMEWVRFFYGEVYIRILGVQLTQDKTGGSRALEEVRGDFIDDKTPPAVQARDQAWTLGYAHDICEVNYPSVKRELWPQFSSDTATVPALEGAQISAILNVGTMLALKQMTPTYAEKTLVASGIPQEWAKDMVDSTVEERENLEPAEPRVPQASDAPEEINA